MRWLIAAMLLCASVTALAARATDAGAFVLDEVFTNGTPADLSDDLLAVARWTDTPGSLVEHGERGLGGGLEYAVAPEFCERLRTRFIDKTPPSCDDLRAAIQRAFGRWSDGHPVLRFVDVSDRIAPEVRTALSGDVGAEIDLMALTEDEFGGVRGFGAYTGFWFLRRQPVGTNGRLMPGSTLTSVDIVFNPASCFHMDPELEGQRCNHFESLVLHEIGHALALDHPNQFPERNFDDDDEPGNPIAIDCEQPERGLRLSATIDPEAVMNSSRMRPEPVHRALSNDDLAGRDFLYPICA